MYIKVQGSDLQAKAICFRTNNDMDIIFAPVI